MMRTQLEGKFIEELINLILNAKEAGVSAEFIEQKTRSTGMWQKFLDEVDASLFMEERKE